MRKQRVLLVGPDQEENLSLRYLASSLVAAGHDVVIAPFNRSADRTSVVEAARETTLVGLSLCFQVRATEFLELARELKARAPARPVVAGGHFATCAAEELLARHPELDVIVAHEGERTLVELADALGRGQDLGGVAGLVLRDGQSVCVTAPRRVLEDLDELPPPLRMGPARLLAGVPTAYVLGSRGCVGHCDYCCIMTLHRRAGGKRFRQRRPERVAAEMAQLYHDRGVRQFIFHDDNFLVPSLARNQRRLDALQRALEERGVRDIALTLKCRPQDVQEPVFRQLRQMGLIRVFLGVESASERGLACLGREHTREQASAVLSLCQQLGISAQYTMMMFHPAATLESCQDDLDFMERHVDHPLNFCRTEIYAGTPLERRMIAEGRARGSYLGRSYSIEDPRAQWASDVATRLFLARCWQSGSLMERAIGLDHLAAVMQQFYGERSVEDLAERILAWRLSVNRSTLALLGELLELAAAGQPDLAPLRAAEARSRETLLAEGLALFDELNDLSLSLVGLERQDASVVRARRPLGRRLARHAAAALLAVGVASFSACDEGGTSEYAPPPVDGQIEIGQSEFAPPPLDAGPEARVEMGQAEYAPPPLDARMEMGQAEYAPPPVDGGPDAKKK